MTIGIVGAGQLGRMMALAGYPLGLEFLFLDRDARTPGGQVAPILEGELTNRELLGQLSGRCEVITFDWENIPVEALQDLPGRARIAPSLRALAAAQDRLSEKRTFELLGIPTTRYAVVDSRAGQAGDFRALVRYHDDHRGHPGHHGGDLLPIGDQPLPGAERGREGDGSRLAVGTADYTDTIAVSTAVWLVVVQWVSSCIAGYMAGRLRTKWVGVHTDEVFFRDTAQALSRASTARALAFLRSSAIERFSLPSSCHGKFLSLWG
jgi:hypothetical protein